MASSMGCRPISLRRIRVFSDGIQRHAGIDMTTCSIRTSKRKGLGRVVVGAERKQNRLCLVVVGAELPVTSSTFRHTLHHYCLESCGNSCIVLHVLLRTYSKDRTD